MAQAQVIPNEGVGEIVRLSIGGTATKVQNIVVCKTACPAATASGIAQCTQSVDAGLTIVSAATVTSSSNSFATDTFMVSHPFTAVGAEAAIGFVCAHSHATIASASIAYGICSFASVVNLEAADTLTLTMKWRGKNG